MTAELGYKGYVTQDDALMTTLTVKEAVYYSAQLKLPNSMSKSEKKERAEMTINEMGLQDGANTRIGGWDSKGLSGGQKRRLSICIEEAEHLHPSISLVVRCLSSSIIFAISLPVEQFISALLQRPTSFLH
ncbi:ABC transporter G family member 1-like [Tasmannia lanceolata]|uniref:ABC transporter G family member 1-like n=1 Tax=Tasmannia lanceolata TaxID=3420 RepID=UPI004062A5A7